MAKGTAKGATTTVPQPKQEKETHKRERERNAVPVSPGGNTSQVQGQSSARPAKCNVSQAQGQPSARPVKCSKPQGNRIKQYSSVPNN